jgi:hypothetical protein
MILKNEIKKNQIYKVIYKDNSQENKPKVAFCYIIDIDDFFINIKYPDGNKKIISIKNSIMSITEASQ